MTSHHRENKLKKKQKMKPHENRYNEKQTLFH